jgi:ABC-type sugar transport system ATPase subunit
VDIEYLLDRNPTQLSGGEKQRVALGRCITRDPQLFLLDEPFSNLDQPLREKYRRHLKTLLNHFNITTVYVTHDQHEALLLADLIAIMDIGTIEQVGTPEDIYQNPASIFVANFLNPDSETPPMNWLQADLVADTLHEFTGMLGIRPEDMTVSAEWSIGSLKGILTDIRHNPIRRVTILTVMVKGTEIVVQAPLQQDFQVEQEIYVTLHTYHLFETESGRRIQTY